MICKGDLLGPEEPYKEDNSNNNSRGVLNLVSTEKKLEQPITAAKDAHAKIDGWAYHFQDIITNAPFFRRLF